MSRINYKELLGPIRPNVFVACEYNDGSKVIKEVTSATHSMIVQKRAAYRKSGKPTTEYSKGAFPMHLTVDCDGPQSIEEWQSTIFITSGLGEKVRKLLTQPEPKAAPVASTPQATTTTPPATTATKETEEGEKEEQEPDIAEQIKTLGLPELRELAQSRFGMTETQAGQMGSRTLRKHLSNLNKAAE